MRITFMCILLLFATLGRGQADDDVYQATSGGGLLEFDQSQFNGRFAVRAVSMEDYDYYVTDISKLTDRFEKVYFLNLTYSEQRIVNIDPDIDKSQLWFKAYYQYMPGEIVCLLEDFMKEAKQISQAWAETEKQSWLQKHDKFKTREENDQ